MAKDNPLAWWRQQFHYDPDVVPDPRELPTLEDILDRVGAAFGYIQALENPTASEIKEALAVAGMAVQFVERVYEHMNWMEGPPLPKPTNFGVAKKVLESLLADARAKRALRWSALGDADQSETAQNNIIAEAKQKACTPKTTIHDDEANVLVRKFLEKNPSATAREVAKGVGIALGRIPEMPAWRAEHGKRKASRKPRPKRIRSLTKKMLNAIGKEDDSATKLEAEDIAWQELLEKAKPQERANLHAMNKVEKARLIQTYLESRTQEEDDFGEPCS
jgi:hypothetical protein